MASIEVQEMLNYRRERAVELYLETNKSLQEIANIINEEIRTHCPSLIKNVNYNQLYPRNVWDLLSNKFAFIKLWGEAKTEEIMHQIETKKEKQSHVEYLFSTGVESEKTKYREMGLPDINPKILFGNLKLTSEDADKNNLRMLCNIILKFGLSRNLVNYFFNINPDELLAYLDRVHVKWKLDVQTIAIQKTFSYASIPENASIKNFLDYYNRMLTAGQNYEEKKKLWYEVSDAKALEIQKIRQNESMHLVDQIAVLLDFQFKYLLSINEMSKIFKCNMSNYRNAADAYLADKPELYARYHNIIDLHYNKHIAKDNEESFEWNPRANR